MTKGKEAAPSEHEKERRRHKEESKNKKKKKDKNKNRSKQEQQNLEEASDSDDWVEKELPSLPQAKVCLLPERRLDIANTAMGYLVYFS